MGSRTSRSIVASPPLERVGVWESGLFASPVLEKLRMPEMATVRSKSTVDEFTYAVTLPNGAIIEHLIIHNGSDTPPGFDRAEWRGFHTICSQLLRVRGAIKVTFRVRTLLTANSSIADTFQIVDRSVLELVLKRLLPLAFPPCSILTSPGLTSPGLTPVEPEGDDGHGQENDGFQSSPPETLPYDLASLHPPFRDVWPLPRH